MTYSEQRRNQLARQKKFPMTNQQKLLTAGQLQSATSTINVQTTSLLSSIYPFDKRLIPENRFRIQKTLTFILELFDVQFPRLLTRYHLQQKYISQHLNFLVRYVIVWQFYDLKVGNSHQRTIISLLFWIGTSGSSESPPAQAREKRPGGCG